MGSISYDPVPNGGEGPRGQGNCASAIEGVIDTVRLAVCLYADAAVHACACVCACMPALYVLSEPNELQYLKNPCGKFYSSKHQPNRWHFNRRSL